MTELEEREILREKYKNAPSKQARAVKKRKLKVRYRHRLNEAITQTQEKLDLLKEIQRETL